MVTDTSGLFIFTTQIIVGEFEGSEYI